MPITGTPDATVNGPISNFEIRMFLRDVAGQVPGTGVQNILFDLPEFSNDDINRAIKFTVARYNVVTPISNDTAATMNAWILLIGVCECLMLSESFRQLRNQATVADGDIAPVGLDEKNQAYVAMAQMLKAEFEEKAKGYKITQNAAQAYGNLGSGYRSVSRYFHA